MFARPISIFCFGARTTHFPTLRSTAQSFQHVSLHAAAYSNHLHFHTLLSPFLSLVHAVRKHSVFFCYSVGSTCARICCFKSRIHVGEFVGKEVNR
ncbi:hypothetical protein, unlikely [Trypanosoma brucei brucei TREU927]|uniref:Uncharacterized protein n=1 Tax=Trypanosoma brucei brucei (strain 927/4 GUTat10.1) TaxID=185431 RepID=Q38FX5_TRYB2|nr:hypothetical protein, unlikely [Trypanosoma brucei brucei TREU927]EAN76295.1 hypothetical protein, unlikely [Trypanosoma brucei brucei TREU927]